MGTSIVTRAGPSVRVVKVEKREGKVAVYNFSVQDSETFFVGNNALWVHNCPETGDGFRKPDRFSIENAQANADGAAEFKARDREKRKAMKKRLEEGEDGTDLPDSAEEFLNSPKFKPGMECDGAAQQGAKNARKNNPRGIPD